MESLPPLKREEIPLPFDAQEEDDRAFKSRAEDAVEEEIFKAAQDEDNLPVMVGQKEESVHHVFIDPVAEYMEALTDSSPQARILFKG